MRGTCSCGATSATGAGRPTAGRTRPARHRPLRGRKPRRPQHPRPGAFMQTNVEGTFTLLEAARAYWSELDRRLKETISLPARQHRRGVRQPAARRRRRSPKQNAYEPNSPYSASKAASDHLVRAWHHTYGLPVLTTNCSNNYGPVSLPREADPADDRQRAGRQAAAGLRRRPAGARLALRAATIAAPSAPCWHAAASARPTTSAAGTRRPTSRSSRPSAHCSTNCGPSAERHVQPADHAT